jgi:uncharacterized protein (DUF58 family)
MPTITVPDDTYQRLAERAAALGTTAEALAIPALERAACGTSPATIPPADGWQQRFDALNALILSRADRYPPGYQADVSREAIYEGCGE